MTKNLNASRDAVEWMSPLIDPGLVLIVPLLKDVGRLIRPAFECGQEGFLLLSRGTQLQLTSDVDVISIQKRRLLSQHLVEVVGLS